MGIKKRIREVRRLQQTGETERDPAGSPAIAGELAVRDRTSIHGLTEVIQGKEHER